MSCECHSIPPFRKINRAKGGFSMKKLTLLSLLFLCILTFQTGCVSQPPEKSSLPSEQSGQLLESTEPAQSSVPATPDNSLRDLDTIKTSLAQYSNDLDELAESDSYVILHGQQYSGSRHWDSFYENVQNNIPDHLTLVQFTVEGDAILSYLDYDGKDFYMISDYSRDAFMGDEDKYQAAAYSCLKVFDHTRENGDFERLILLTDLNDLTLEQYESYSGPDIGTDLKLSTLALITLGNEHAVLSGEEAWHEVATTFDETSILASEDNIDKIEVIKGSTGESLTLNEGADFEDILSLYKAMDFQPYNGPESRSGYAYLLRLYDKDGVYLQTVMPYKDAVQINGTLYDSSMNGTAIQLLQKLASLWQN